MENLTTVEIIGITYNILGILLSTIIFGAIVYCINNRMKDKVTSLLIISLIHLILLTIISVINMQFIHIKYIELVVIILSIIIASGGILMYNEKIEGDKFNEI